MDKDSVVKITNAVYRILNFLPESDPLKTKAKEKALAILENATLVFINDGWFSLQKEKASVQLLDDIDILENYLEIGKGQGWIDHMNFLIITKEYDQIKNSISRPRGIIKETVHAARQINHIERNVKDLRHKNVVQNPTLGELSARQRKILEVLGSQEKAQVADFIKQLPNITKRTIRRDLDDLLKKGKVTRTGEWNQVFYKKSDRTNEIKVIMS